MMEIKKDIAGWWAKNPMSYAETHGTEIYRIGDQKVKEDFSSRDFFERADAQLFSWNTPLHDGKAKFGKIFPYDRYREKDVLEVGCGMGAMAMLWAKAGARVTATDLNPFSIAQTKRRFELFGFSAAAICQEDANALSFVDDSFDYVYSWGVLHHSPDIEKSLEEIFRVLKPGGEFGIMVYNRHSLLHLYHTRYLEGFLHAESRFLSHRSLASRYGDGHREEGNPYTWPMTRREMETLLAPKSRRLKTALFGTELDSTLMYMLPGLFFFIPKTVRKCWARRFGWSIWCSGVKQ